MNYIQYFKIFILIIMLALKKLNLRNISNKVKYLILVKIIVDRKVINYNQKNFTYNNKNIFF
jgi:hypothetical protein